MKKKSPKVNDLTPQQLGEMLINIYESGYLDRTTTYKMSFIKGILAGLGGVIGATVVVALLLFILSLTSHLPFVRGVSNNLHSTLEKSKSK